jgi:hypothetical protein
MGSMTQPYLKGDVKVTVREKTFGNDTWEEWARHDPLDTAMWAIAFIWAGLVWMASSLGYLPEQAWALFFLGAGMLALIELAIRSLVPAHRRDLLGTLIWAGAMFCLGGWDNVWPLVLIAVGAFILLRDLFPQLKTILVEEEQSDRQAR